MPDETSLASRLSVYLVMDHALAQRHGRNDLQVVKVAISGGATCIQLRAKSLSTQEQWEIGRQIREVTRAHGTLFIVNDRIDLALALDADGVHLGEEDLPVAVARQLAARVRGPDFVIGFSTDSLNVAQTAVEDGADYIGVGNLFGTATKADAGPPIGLEPLSRIVQNVSVPVIGIGGITQENADEVMRAGAVGVAVVSSIVAADNIMDATRSLSEEVHA